MTIVSPAISTYFVGSINKYVRSPQTLLRSSETKVNIMEIRIISMDECDLGFCWRFRLSFPISSCTVQLRINQVDSGSIISYCSTNYIY